jgi:aquaporin Z
MTLTLVHIFGIFFTGTSVNPARSLAPAVLSGGDALKNVWVFIVGPFAGALMAALVHMYFTEEDEAPAEAEEAPAAEA